MVELLLHKGADVGVSNIEKVGRDPEGKLNKAIHEEL